MAYEKCVVRPDEKLEIEITTSDYPYCYDAFEIVVKTMERRGISTKIPSFKREKVEGKNDILRYKFVMRKLINTNDLPF